MSPKLKRLEWLLIFLVVCLSIIGIIAIGSATHIYDTDGISNKFSSQKIWFLVGVATMIFFIFIDYEIMCRLYLLIYIFNLILLVLVLVIGKDDGGVSRWIYFGSFGIQPSEFSKIFTILFLSNLINLNHKKINKPDVLCFILFSSLISVGLIAKQPSLSASLVVLFVTLALLFIAGLDYKYIYCTSGIVLPTVIFFVWDALREKHLLVDKFLTEYQIERITGLIKSDPHGRDYYQTNNSMYAIGSGQIFGKGLYNGTVNRLNYLPESHNDFIFSVIGEEFGFIGCMLILCLLFAVIFICFRIAKNSNRFLGKLVAGGIASMFMFQTFVHVGVTTGILPNTGMPLPFVSYGGSSMLVNMMAIGIVINIGLSSNRRLFS